MHPCNVDMCLHACVSTCVCMHVCRCIELAHTHMEEIWRKLNLTIWRKVGGGVAWEGWWKVGGKCCGRVGGRLAEGWRGRGPLGPYRPRGLDSDPEVREPELWDPKFDPEVQGTSALRSGTSTRMFGTFGATVETSAVKVVDSECRRLEHCSGNRVPNIDFRYTPMCVSSWLRAHTARPPHC